MCIYYTSAYYILLYYPYNTDYLFNKHIYFMYKLYMYSMYSIYVHICMIHAENSNNKYILTLIVVYVYGARKLLFK